MRAGRLISLITILGREGRTTAAELARRLEVSERTILRDIEVLSGSGVPVYATRGPTGGFQLLDGFTPSLGAEGLARGSGRFRGGVLARGTSRMTVRISAEGRRTAAILGHLHPLRVRPGQSDTDWVTASCRMRDRDSMSIEVLALGPQVEVLAPVGLRDHVAGLARGMAKLYAS